MPQLVPFYFIIQVIFAFRLLTIIIYVFSKYILPRYVHLFLISSPPKPYAFEYPPLQSFLLSSALNQPSASSDPAVQACVELRERAVQYERLLDLTNRAPRIIDKIDEGKNLSTWDKSLAKDIGIEFDENGRPEAAAKNILQQLANDSESKRENEKELKRTQSQLEGLIKAGKSDYQDSSDITSDCDPFDPFDPDG